MIVHLLAAEFAEVAEALKGAEPELAGISISSLQAKATRTPPCWIFSAEVSRSFGARAAYVRVSLLVESITGDEGDAPNNHLARVALAQRLFVDFKANRIAELNTRGKVRISDYGPTPSRATAGSDNTGDKLRSTLALLVAAELV